MYLPLMAIHTATGEASRVYSISVNRTTDGCYLRGRGASCMSLIKYVSCVWNDGVLRVFVLSVPLLKSVVEEFSCRPSYSK